MCHIFGLNVTLFWRRALHVVPHEQFALTGCNKYTRCGGVLSSTETEKRRRKKFSFDERRVKNRTR